MSPTRFTRDPRRSSDYIPSSVPVQSRLPVRAPGDSYEREADLVADHVMRMSEPPARYNCPCGGECPRCLDDLPVQGIFRSSTKVTHASEMGQIAAPPSIHEVLATPGHPLGVETRAIMEPRFGYDFSGIRIHTDSKAVQSANDANAVAYTAGRDIVFGADRPAFDTPEGNRLLAHELTHVIQQNNASGLSVVIQRKSKVSQTLGMRVVTYDDGRVEVTANQPWTEESGIGSTIIGMARVIPGISVTDLIKELIDCGAYKNEHQVREGFIQGTRIVVKNGKVLEISVRGKVYKAGGVKKPGFDYFLLEGSRIFNKAGYELTAGGAQGVDEKDGYDSRYWTEKGARGTIQARIPAWDAMDKMVKNIGKDVPKAGGGKTKWSFDCFEASRILRLYAIWRTTTRSDFNRAYRPLKLGFHADTKTGLGKTFHCDGPGKPAYKYVGGIQSGGLLMGATKVTLKKSIIDIALDAPVGSAVTFGSTDIQKRCAANPKLSYCDFQYEHTIKIGNDRFFAHPFGVVSSGKIFEEMAKVVGATPNLAYYRKKLYVSAVIYPK
jgi:hypothetical protein